MPKPFDPVLREPRTDLDKRGEQELLALIIGSTFLCAVFCILIRLFR